MAASGTAGGPANQAGAPSADGPGEWIQATENMSEQARRYQAQVTGAPEGYVYRIRSGGEEVKFDGFDRGVLLEAKGPGYAQWINKRLEFFGNFEGREQMLDQAVRQVRAANGKRIRWLVAEEKLAGALRKLFLDEQLPIEVVHVPPVL